VINSLRTVAVEWIPTQQNARRADRIMFCRTEPITAADADHTDRLRVIRQAPDESAVEKLDDVNRIRRVRRVSPRGCAGSLSRARRLGQPVSERCNRS